MKKQWYKRWGVIVIFIFLSLLIVNYYLEDSKIKTTFDEKNWEEKYIRDSLNEKGYEVLRINFGNYDIDMARWWGFTDDRTCYPYRGSSDYSNSTDVCWANYTQASLQMKSLGNRNSQVWDALILLSIYKDVSNYRISILELTQECIYNLKGDVYESWVGHPENAEYYNLINTQIRESEKCS